MTEYLWPPERTKKLHELWPYTTLSLSKIAELIDPSGKLSRSAVAGKARRDRLPARKPVTGFMPKVPRERIKALQKKTFEKQGRAVSERKHVSRPCSILDLTDTSCRYPFGSPGTKGFFFCGSETQLGESWCAYHMTIVWQRYSVDELEAA